MARREKFSVRDDIDQAPGGDLMASAVAAFATAARGEKVGRFGTDLVN